MPNFFKESFKTVNTESSVIDDSKKKVKELELLELFRTTLDPKGSGEVSGEDLKHVLSCLGQSLAPDELGVIDNFTDKDGFVRYEKLLKDIIFS